MDEYYWHVYEGYNKYTYCSSLLYVYFLCVFFSQVLTRIATEPVGGGRTRWRWCLSRDGWTSRSDSSESRWIPKCASKAALSRRMESMALPLLPDAIVNLKSFAHTLTHHNNCYCDLWIISNALYGCLPVVMAPIAPAVHIVVVGVVSRREVKVRADYLGNSL